MPIPAAAQPPSTLGQACEQDSDCDDGVYCNGAERCSERVCVAGDPIAVDDGVACTLDYCDEAARRVVNEPYHSLCSDGVFCNGTELCDATLGCVAGPAVPTGVDGWGCNELICIEHEQRVDVRRLEGADAAMCGPEEP